MRQSMLEPVKGTEISAPQWDLTPISSILSYAGQDFIYVAELTDGEFAIVHWADTENEETISQDINVNNKTLKEYLSEFYSRKMVIPATKNEIFQIRTGILSMREFYLSKKIYLVEGLNECLDEIRVWENISEEQLNGYLPDPGHKLGQETEN